MISAEEMRILSLRNASGLAEAMSHFRARNGRYSVVGGVLCLCFYVALKSNDLLSMHYYSNPL
jgi:hypothetical protein